MTEAGALFVGEPHRGLKFAVAFVAERLREANDRRRVDAHAFGHFTQRGKCHQLRAHEEGLGQPALLARQALQAVPDLGKRRMLPDVIVAHAGLSGTG